MSQLQYFAYPDYGVRLRERNSYNQAVLVGDRIECSGQGTYDILPLPLGFPLVPPFVPYCFLVQQGTWLTHP